VRHVSFFVSSRGRHTRCLSDWSSDVCSSDLANAFQARFGNGFELIVVANACTDGTVVLAHELVGQHPQVRVIDIEAAIGKGGAKIGRASCRGRGWRQGWKEASQRSDAGRWVP